jgi:hypothetical protein
MYYFFCDFRYREPWERNIFPLLNSFRNKELFAVDWKDFIWGTTCFRQEYVMFLDPSIEQIGRKFPPMLDEKNNPIIDEGGQWLENTKFIEEIYTEYFKIPLDEFIEICKRWYKEVLID